jgi:hypothetical protein
MKPNYSQCALILADGELIDRVDVLATRTHITTAELVAHLAELDGRGLYLPLGHGSLFSYCRERLKFSEYEAYERIHVARAARRFPLVVELLAAGAVNLTAVRLLAPYLTPENHAALLASARGLRRREVEEIVARISPKPDVPASVRKLPVPAASPVASADRAPVASLVAAEPIPAAVPTAIPKDAPVPTSPPAPRPVIAPLSPDRYKLQVTITGDTLEMLELAQDLMRHAIPSGDPAAVLHRALTVLTAELVKKKFAVVDKPRDSADDTAHDARPDSRHIPAEVKRTVWLRDRGRCAFIAPDGHRCGARGFVQLHHVDPHAYGGSRTVANIQLQCGRHNRYEWQVANVRHMETIEVPAAQAKNGAVTWFEPSSESIRARRSSP